MGAKRPASKARPDGGEAPAHLGSWLDIIRIPPFHNWLGITVEKVEHGRAVIRLPFRKELIGNPAIPAIHGGIVAALADLTAGVAAFTITNAATPTIDLAIDYVRPALPKDIIAEAHVINAGKTVAFVDFTLKQEGTLVASGRCLMSTKSAKAKPESGDHPIG